MNTPTLLLPTDHSGQETLLCTPWFLDRSGTEPINPPTDTDLLQTRRIHLSEQEVLEAKERLLCLGCHLTQNDIHFLINELTAGRFCGIYNESDLPGLLARHKQVSRKEIVTIISYKENRDDPFVYWSNQVCGPATSSDPFVCLTIAWLHEILNQKNHTV